MAEKESRLQSQYLTHANPSTSRGATMRGVMTGPRHTYHGAVPDIADEIQARITRHLRALDFHTTDEDS